MLRRLGWLILLTAILEWLGQPAHSQTDWSGQAQCQLGVQSPNYTYQEVQTWTITGPPTGSGSLRVYPAVWSVAGQGGRSDVSGPQMTTAQWTTNVPGINAPIAIFVNSANQLIIKSYHSQLRADGGVTGTQAVTVGGAQKTTPVSYSRMEWQFPIIETDASLSEVSGTSSNLVTQAIGPMQPPGLRGSATCQWQFSKSGNGLTSSVPTAAPDGSATAVPANVIPPVNAIPAASIPSGTPQVAGSAAPSQPNAATPADGSAPARTGANQQQSANGNPAHPTPQRLEYGDDDVDDTPPTGYFAQIMFQIDQTLDDDSIKQMSPAEWQQFEKQTGGKLVPSEHVFRFAPTPAVGYWLHVGDRRHMISYKGMVNVPTKPTKTTDLELFVQVSDDHPYAVIPSVEFVPADQKPKPTVFKLIQKLPVTMNHTMQTSHVHGNDWERHLDRVEYADGNVESHSGCMMPVAQQSNNPIFQLIPDRCRQRAPCTAGDNSTRCCLDYNGPYGDGNPISRDTGLDCYALGAKFFEWSTCFVWTVAGACANEGALPWNNTATTLGPACWENHKYRNCQNLNPNDFKLSPPAELITMGQSVDMVLRNNTVGNSTCLNILGNNPPATLDLRSNGTLVHSLWCGTYRADHFSDQAQKHYENMALRFQTPKSTSQRPCSVTYKIIGDSGGKSSRSTIVATNPLCGGWSGTITMQSQTEYGVESDVGGAFESTVHMTETQDLTLSFQNSVGVASGDADLNYEAKNWQGALRDQVRTRIVEGHTTMKGKARTGSAASIEVEIDSKQRTYTLKPSFKTSRGTLHTLSTHYDEVIIDADTPYYVDPRVNSHFPGFYGTLTDPKHIHGQWSENLPPPSGHSYTGGTTVAVEWDLTFVPARK